VLSLTKHRIQSGTAFFISLLNVRWPALCVLGSNY